ncbi:MAG: carbohydrate ABC transporter permease, partial [Candidatus Krumholzibacteriota bacterium]|nr:carbohydrate ABC transporter permease [Candidatus Krumholzibacteriota bacterium]
MSRAARRRLARAAGLAGLALAALLFLAPVLLMIAGSLKPDERVLAEAGSLRGLFAGGLSLQNYRDVFARVD